MSSDLRSIMYLVEAACDLCRSNILKRLPAAALLICFWVPCSLPLGCKEEPGEMEAGSPDAAQESLQKEEQSGFRPFSEEEEEKISVNLVDGEKKPVVAARVLLLYSPFRSPRTILQKVGKTNIQGEITFTTESLDRAAVRSEFCRENHEIDLQESGESGITLQVSISSELSGTVKGPDGRGINGASVFLAKSERAQQDPRKGDLPIPGAGISGEEFTRRFGYDLLDTAETDGEGSFFCTLRGVAPLLATAHADGFSSTGWQWVIPDRDGNSFEEVEISLLPTGQVDFTLFDARGQPLADRFVAFFERPESRTLRMHNGRIYGEFRAVSATGSDGAATLHLPAGPMLDMEEMLLFPAPAEGKPKIDPVHDEPMNSLILQPGQRFDLVASPPPVARLHGRVIDEEGIPIPNARGVLPVNVFFTGEKGEYSLLVPYNDHLRMEYSISCEGFETRSGRIPRVAEGSLDIDLDITLVRAGAVRVAVSEGIRSLWLIGPSSEAKTFPDVEGIEMLPAEDRLFKGTPQRNGFFLFKDMSPGDYTLLAQRGTFSFTRIPGVMLDPPKGGEQVVKLPELLTSFVEPPPTWVEGIVEIPKGLQPHQIDVTLLRTDLPEARRWDPLSLGKGDFGWKSMKATAEGRFLFKALSPGRYALSATLVEWDRRIDLFAEEQIVEGANKVTIPLISPEDLGDTVISLVNAEGEGLCGVGLFLLDPVDSPLGPAMGSGLFLFSDPAGRIELKALLPGRYGFSLNRLLSGMPILNGRFLSKPGAGEAIEIVLP